MHSRHARLALAPRPRWAHPREYRELNLTKNHFVKPVDPSPPHGPTAEPTRCCQRSPMGRKWQPTTNTIHSFPPLSPPGAARRCSLPGAGSHLAHPPLTHRTSRPPSQILGVEPHRDKWDSPLHLSTIWRSSGSPRNQEGRVWLVLDEYSDQMVGGVPAAPLLQRRGK